MRQRWLGGRALLLHAGALVVVPGCCIAFWWQLHRALGGNDLSWAYTFEWPIFAVLGVIGWWQLVHDTQEDVRLRREVIARAAEVAPARPSWADREEDPELAAYNRYLAELAASGRRKSWRHT